MAGHSFLNKEGSDAQEQAVPLCHKMSQQGRRPAWMNRESFLRLQEKNSLPPVEEGMGNSWRVQRSC